MFDRRCSTCGKQFHTEASWLEHLDWGHKLRTCEVCGTVRIKMIIDDPDSLRGHRTVYYCPACKAAVCNIRNADFVGMKDITGPALEKLVRSYNAVAGRLQHAVSEVR